MVRSSLLLYAFILAYICMRKNVENSKQLLLWSQCCSNVIWSLLGIGERMIAKMVIVHWPRWLPRPYMVKPFKTLLLQNQITPGASSFTQIIVDRRSTKIAKIMDPRWCLTFLWQGCICFPQAFVRDLYIISEKMFRLHNLRFSSKDYDPIELKLDEEHRSA